MGSVHILRPFKVTDNTGLFLKEEFSGGVFIVMKGLQIKLNSGLKLIQHTSGAIIEADSFSMLASETHLSIEEFVSHQEG